MHEAGLLDFPDPMKITVRLLVALFGAIFGSLMVSVQICSYARGGSRYSRQPHWQRPRVWPFVSAGHPMGSTCWPLYL